MFQSVVAMRNAALTTVDILGLMIDLSKADSDTGNDLARDLANAVEGKYGTCAQELATWIMQSGSVDVKIMTINSATLKGSKVSPYYSYGDKEAFPAGLTVASTTDFLKKSIQNPFDNMAFQDFGKITVAW